MSTVSNVARAVASVAVGIAVGAGVLELFDEETSSDRAVADWVRPGEAEPGDRVRAAIAGLADDRVHVTVDGRAMLDEQGEAEVAAAIAERDLPVYVVVWRESRDAGYDHYIEAAEQIAAELDEPSVVVLWQGPENSWTEVPRAWRFPYTVETEDDRVVEREPEYLGDARRRLLEWIEQLPDEPLVPIED